MNACQLQVGSRVLKKGWERYPEFEYLARYGRVTHVAGPRLVEVRWDSGAEANHRAFGKACGTAPARCTLEQVGDLLHIWWRSS